MSRHVTVVTRYRRAGPSMYAGLVHRRSSPNAQPGRLLRLGMSGWRPNRRHVFSDGLTAYILWGCPPREAVLALRIPVVGRGRIVQF